MDKIQVLDAIKQAREAGQKRNFSQSYDLIITLKDLDLKKPDNQVDFFQQMPFGQGKKKKVCALVSQELAASAKECCDQTVLDEEFPKYAQDKKLLKKLARQNDFFIAQANIMPQVASTFGKVLGPKGKMPNPKAGCVVPPKTNLVPLYEKLQKTVKVSAKTMPVIMCLVGTEQSPEEEVAENILTIYENVLHHLPNALANIRQVKLKLTMSPPIVVGTAVAAKEETAAKGKKGRKPAKANAAPKAAPKKKAAPKEKVQDGGAE